MFMARPVLKLIPASFLVLALSLFARLPAQAASSPTTATTDVEVKPVCGDAMVVGSIGDARTLVPILASDSSSQDIVGMIFNGLVKYDKDLNIVGDLAREWSVSPDGLKIIFHLRPDVRWHDGHPFTARDVEYTFKRLTDPLVRTPYAGDFERVKEFIVLDDHTVSVLYKEPFSPALASWSMWIMPRHLLEKEDLNKTAFSRAPVGTGPYRFRRWKTQEKIELVANKDYFDRRPFIDRYLYRVIPDEATIFLELQTGGIDMAPLSPLQFSRQTDTPFFARYYQKYRLPSFGYTYLGYNLIDERFKDRRVRQALNGAVDKKEIVRIVLSGFGEPATGPFIPDSWAYDRSVNAAEFDPHRACALLDEAGWRTRDREGWRVKDGRRFEFTITTNQGSDERVKVAEIIQRRLKDVGVKVTIRVVEWSVFVTECINKRKFEAVLLGWGLGRDPDNYDIWHSSRTGEGQFNFVGYHNDEVDRLLTLGRRSFDQKERADCYHRVHRLIYEDQPYMFLYVPDRLLILHKRFQGVKPAASGIGYNFNDWWVPRSLQKYHLPQASGKERLDR